MEEEVKIRDYAEHCLNCKAKPCSGKGCPLSNDIPAFIKSVKEKNIKEAYNILIQTTMIGGVCGRICPHEKQCQGSCVRGIKGEPVQIGKIEAYVFDKALESGYEKEISKTDEIKGRKIAVIGSGPASLTASAFLARSGAEVTIYEKYQELGGILRHGIPQFRLEKEILNKNIYQILNLGINVKLGKELGRNITIEELKSKYDAIFIGIGANIPNRMNVPGEELNGVYGGNALLEKGLHPNYEGKKVAVIGGGNVAMDSARTIKNMGAEKVVVIYRRAKEQMPAERKEIEEAIREGVQFLFQTNIIKIIGKENVEKIECVKTKLLQKDGENRLSPVDIKNSNFLMDIDYVVEAIGSKPELEIVNKLGLELTDRGYIKVDENYKTSDRKVYAGGDLSGTTQTVAWAAYTGREAAKAIIKEMKK